MTITTATMVAVALLSDERPEESSEGSAVVDMETVEDTPAPDDVAVEAPMSGAVDVNTAEDVAPNAVDDVSSGAVVPGADVDTLGVAAGGDSSLATVISTVGVDLASRSDCDDVTNGCEGIISDVMANVSCNDVTGNVRSGVISIIDDVGITCTDEDSINDDVIKISLSDDIMESSTFDDTSISDDVIEDSVSNDVITIVNV